MKNTPPDNDTITYQVRYKSLKQFRKIWDADIFGEGFTPLLWLHIATQILHMLAVMIHQCNRFGANRVNCPEDMGQTLISEESYSITLTYKFATEAFCLTLCLVCLSIIYIIRSTVSFVTKLGIWGFFKDSNPHCDLDLMIAIQLFVWHSWLMMMHQVHQFKRTIIIMDIIIYIVAIFEDSNPHCALNHEDSI